MIDAGVDSFILHAALAGLGLAIAAGPLGCVVVWRRMAYFGDTLAHSALLGVVLALSLQWLPVIGVIAVGIVITSLLFWLERRRGLSTDTLLGILSHSALAIGIIVVSLFQGSLPGIEINSLLFGDILSVSVQDLLTVYISAAIVLVSFARYWREMVSVSAHEELARIDGINVGAIRYLFMLLMAVVIAFSVKVVGVLLITAMLIIPAASARLFSRSPLQMIVLSVAVAVASVTLGMLMSLQWDLPTGPAMVLAASMIFVVSRSVTAAGAASS